MAIMPPNGERPAGTEIGQAELDRIFAILEDAQVTEGITEWEAEFCNSLAERLNTYGAHTYLSAKQLGVIARIEDKIAAEERGLMGPDGAA